MTPEIAIKAALQVGLTFELPANKLVEYAQLIADYEREECAKVCDEIDRRWINQADKCAAAIRSRT